jgi:non-specific serine/threonine protein kinase
MLEPGTILQGRYRLDSELGRGGMGAVYRATDLRFGSTVALKQMTVEGEPLRRAFEREARLLNGLRHRALPVVMDYFAEGDGVFLVMQFIPGDDLGALLVRSGRPFPAETVAAWADRLLEALEYLHSRVPPVVHRDIKPQNLKLTPEGDLILLDFGLAKDSASQAARSVAGFTPFYAPLEQMRGEGTDPSSDVYALSATLFHLLTATLPTDALRRAEAVVAGLPDPLVRARERNPEVPAALSELIAVGMALARYTRPSVAAYREGLLAAMQHTAIGMPPRAFDGSGGLDDAATLTVEPSDEATTATLDRTADASTVPNNLPHALTSFVGRVSDLDGLTRGLAAARMVTVTGPGGIGKTRLAVRAAAGALERFPGGAWLVDLAPVRSGEAVAAAIAAAAGVREEPGESIADTVARRFRTARTLLVLDNCEHLVAACGELVDQLLRSCLNLTVLAASREALAVDGELVRQLAPLAVPPDDPAPPRADATLRYDAVTLFRDRARLANPAFEVKDENAADVAEICRRLDGIPLAIELAAVRVKALPVEQIRSRLGDRLSFLTRGVRTSAPRHQTLRATIDWSHDLLGEDERAVFRRLAVFGGGCTMVAAETVCAGGPAPHERVAVLVEQLVEKSLVTIGDGEGGLRFRMLEVVHQYASEKLATSGEDDDVRRRHRTWFASFAESASRELDGPSVGDWVARLDADRLNLDGALLWSRSEGDLQTVSRLVKNLSYYWYLRGYWAYRVWYERLLAYPELPKEFRDVALSWLGGFAYLTGDYEKAATLELECLALRRELGLMNGVGSTLLRLGAIAAIQGDHVSARARYSESLALYTELDDRRGIARALMFLGTVECEDGNYDAAEDLFTKSLAAFPPVAGVFDDISAIPVYRAEIARVRGEYDRARSLVAEHLANARAGGFKHPLGFALCRLGDIELDAGNVLKALANFAEALAINEELGDRMNLAWSIDGIACVAAWRGREREALRLAGCAQAIREKCRVGIPPRANAAFDRYLGAARHALGEDEADAALADGAETPLDEVRAIAKALGCDAAE